MRLTRFCLLLWLAVSIFAGPVYAQRNFPSGVKPAELRGIQYPYVRINDRTFRLAPGARIYDASNRIVVPVSAPQTGKVLFKLDTQGNLLKLWILTPEEVARLSQ